MNQFRIKYESKSVLELSSKKRKRKMRKNIKQSFSKSEEMTLKKKLTKFKRKFLFQFTEDEKNIYLKNKPNDSKLSKNFLLPWERKKKSKNNFLYKKDLKK